MYTNVKTNITNKVLYPQLSYLIMGVLFDIQNELGNNLLEKHYQKAIEIKFKELKIPYKKEVKTSVFFNKEKLGDFFIDFIIDKRIILETKCVPQLTLNDMKQVLRYLESTKMKLGILANFRSKRLEFKRILL